MAQFSRDAHLSNIKVTEGVLVQLTEVFKNRKESLTNLIFNQGNEHKKLFLIFNIRFDNKGYRLLALDEMLHHFKYANNVEGIIITIESSDSLNNKRLIGDHLEVRFDKFNEGSSYLSVTSDDSNWVEASYSSVQEVINKQKTKNGLARSGWCALTIQLLGVIACFILSLWASFSIAPKLKIENSFIIILFFALLIFSNTWGYINSFILACVHRTFPNIQFYRPNKDRINWLMQALIGGIVTALMLTIFGLLFSYIGSIISEMTKN